MASSARASSPSASARPTGAHGRAEGVDQGAKGRSEIVVAEVFARPAHVGRGLILTQANVGAVQSGNQSARSGTEHFRAHQVVAEIVRRADERADSATGKTQRHRSPGRRLVPVGEYFDHIAAPPAQEIDGVAPAVEMRRRVQQRDLAQLTRSAVRLQLPEMRHRAVVEIDADHRSSGVPVAHGFGRRFVVGPTDPFLSAGGVERLLHEDVLATLERELKWLEVRAVRGRDRDDVRVRPRQHLTRVGERLRTVDQGERLSMLKSATRRADNLKVRLVRMPARESRGHAATPDDADAMVTRKTRAGTANRRAPAYPGQPRRGARA